jgi:AraC-like DNA-binding protein
MSKKYLSPSPDKIEYDDPAFRILVARKERPDVNANNFHEEIELKYYFDGPSAMMIDDEVYQINAGDVVVVNPYEIHTNVNIACGGKYYLIILDLDFLIKDNHLAPDVRHLMLGGGVRLANLITGRADLAGLIVRIYDEMTSNAENRKAMVHSLTCQLVTTLLRDHKKSHRAPVSTDGVGRGTELIAPALSKIFRDYASPITVESLADACGISKYHFCRVFKKEMNLTAVEYLNNYRLSVAELLLANDDRSTEDVAATCGFNDVSYFYRCYKKIKNKPLKRKDFRSV